jgi:hypothetical protein
MDTGRVSAASHGSNGARWCTRGAACITDGARASFRGRSPLCMRSSAQISELAPNGDASSSTTRRSRQSGSDSRAIAAWARFTARSKRCASASGTVSGSALLPSRAATSPVVVVLFGPVERVHEVGAGEKRIRQPCEGAGAGWRCPENDA